jgi:hypothetical protein
VTIRGKNKTEEKAHDEGALVVVTRVARVKRRKRYDAQGTVFMSRLKA